MARPRKHFPSSSSPAVAQRPAATWAEQLGEALGRGVARGINAGLSGGLAAPAPAPAAPAPGAPAPAAARRGRPPKRRPGRPAAADGKCKVPGCGNPRRSKGLCSKHYQAARRGALKL